jgi:ABC transporter DrrB family efflux protein
VSTTTVDPARIDIERAGGGPLGAVRDALAITQRNLIAYRRVPQLLVFSTIQPVIFVLMFRYVFGGAVGSVTLPPGKVFPYVDFLMPGIFAQVVVFGSLATAIGLATDLKSGLLERFRSLPMARSAVLAGRTLADLTRNVFVIVLMVLVGFAVGFRIHSNVFALIAGMLLVLLFGYAMCWIFATVGLAVGDPETAQAAAFPVLAPLVFASSAFVPVTSMPGWLQGWANNQPVSVTVSAVRDLMLGLPAASDVLKSVVWLLGILLVFVPLSVRLYRRSV